MEIKDEDMAKLLLVYASEGTTLVCTEDNHYKFWNIKYNDREGEVTTTWGRIGNKIQSSTKPISHWNPRQHVQDLINKKIKKGYEIFSDNIFANR